MPRTIGCYRQRHATGLPATTTRTGSSEFVVYALRRPGYPLLEHDPERDRHEVNVAARVSISRDPMVARLDRGSQWPQPERCSEPRAEPEVVSRFRPRRVQLAVVKPGAGDDVRLGSRAGKSIEEIAHCADQSKVWILHFAASSRWRSSSSGELIVGSVESYPDW